MPQSFLKDPHFTAFAATPLPRSRERRNRETALHHANLIQQRKDTAALILTSTEILLDLPSFPSADPARPSAVDESLVKKSLRPFQPSDYDALIEERNINDLCGYILCPQPLKREGTNAKYRILYGKRKGTDAFKIVEKQKLEKWCSDECAKRTLYVKVQLSEEPAWSRADTPRGDIMLLNYGDANDKSSLIRKMKDLDVGSGEEEVVEKVRALAIERGDGNVRSTSLGLAEVNVEETSNGERRKPSAPRLHMGVRNLARQHDSIEGYRPSFSNGRVKEKTLNDKDKDLMDTI